HCKTKPVYIQNGYAHDFCGKYCAAAFRNGERPLNSRSPSRTSNRPAYKDICKLAGCNEPGYIGPDGIASQWCSQRHRRQAVLNGKAEACLFCKRMPKNLVNGKQSDWCSQRCGQEAINSAPIILPIGEKHTAFENVSSQFKIQWKHSIQVPQVVKIWKLIGDKDVIARFSRYKLTTGRRIGSESGNSRRRWHGTARACILGDNDDETQFCQSPDCFLCSIIQSSFDKAQFLQSTNFGRFGHGIYTSATSSKADAYVRQVQPSPYKAMLLNEVIMGNPIKLTTKDEDLTKPPDGYDSVVGEPGDELNYDESIDKGNPTGYNIGIKVLTRNYVPKGTRVSHGIDDQSS
ncbi:hypothetical protein PHLCEN_2v5282, partial [Hermanssonia centrifuga]